MNQKPTPDTLPTDPVQPVDLTLGRVQIPAATGEGEWWTFIGIPQQRLAAIEAVTGKAGWLTSGEDRIPFCIAERGIFVLNEGRTQPSVLAFTPIRRTPNAFAWHPTIEADFFGILPKVTCNGIAADVNDLTVVEANEAVVRARMTMHWGWMRMTVVLHLTAYSMKPVIEFSSQVVYGTTRNDRQLPFMRGMRIALQSNAFLRPRWIHDPTWSGHRDHEVVLLSQDVEVLRAARVPVRGKLCTSSLAADRFADVVSFGLYDEWDGNWIGSGKLPEATSDMAARWQQIALRANGGAWDAERTFVQPSFSGTTGEQVDFGWSNDLPLLFGTGINANKVLEGMLYQCQSFELRPTGNKETNGMPMQASLHPAARTYNQRPDLDFRRQDPLGWPGVDEQPGSDLAMPYIPSGRWKWGTQDDQHIACAAMHAMILLTNDQALLAVAQDHEELDKTDIYVRQPNWISPRAMGRTTLRRLDAATIFPNQAAAILGRASALMHGWIQVSPIGWNEGNPNGMHTWNSQEEAKYGWFFRGTTNTVRGISVFQEAIVDVACMLLGIRMDDRVLIRKAQLGLRWLATCLRFEDNQPLFSYAQRWIGGARHDASAWPKVVDLNRDREASNDNVFISPAADYWALGAMRLLPTADLDRLLPPYWVGRLLGAPRNRMESLWRAL